MTRVRIFSTISCPYCVAAKRLLDQLSVPYEEIDLTNNPTLRSKISAENGHYRTVPMIFIGDDFIGGFRELDGLHKAGELIKRLNAG